MKFTVLISVYKNDDSVHFDKALRSVTIDQTLRPDEVVLVVDGPVTDDINKVIDQWQSQISIPFIVIRSVDNIGLSNALNLGIKHCKFDYIARMDSDDISLPYRFEKQLLFLNANSEVSLLGGWYKQYDKDMEYCLTERKVPVSFDEIKLFAMTRTPFNHVTAVFKKQSLVDIGGYPEIMGYMEDWLVALCLINKGFKIKNIPEYLVHVRGGTDFLDRRGGIAYARLEIKNLSKMHRLKLIGTRHFLLNLIIRISVRITPLFLRAYVYKMIRKVG